MPPPKQHTQPLVVLGGEDRRIVHRLESVRLGGSPEGRHTYDEAWLQRLVHDQPALLPVGEIEPRFVPAIPVCLELPTPAGSVDNLFVTPLGDLILVECKLWRNPEARRQVVAQIIDYARCLAGWRYEMLEKQVAGGQLPDGSRPAGRLYDLVEPAEELDEAAFVDAVNRNLRLGRALLLIVGDGIREDMEALAEHLQEHAGLHFTLALVELGIFRLPQGGGLLVQPRILCRTLNIDRGIVELRDERITVKPPAVQPGVSRRRPASISEEQFLEALDARVPSLRPRLQSFLERLEPYGVVPEMARSLILRWRPIEGAPFNLAYMYPHGDVLTNAVHWQASNHGVEEISRDYIRELADGMGGTVREWGGTGQWSVAIEGRHPQIWEMLDHADVWEHAIRRFTSRVTETLQEAGQK